MRVLEVSSKARRVKVLVECDEDLWTLKILLKPGDLVEGLTFRDISRESSSVRERRPMVVKLKVERVEFQPFSGKLRVFGVIVEGPEEYGVRGKHHSLYIAPGDVITLEREEGWSERALERIRSSGPRSRALIVSVDYEEYALGLIASHGFKVLAEGSSGIPGKDDPRREEALERYVARVAEAVIEALREGIEVVIVVGPGYVKQMVASKLREMGLKARVYLDDTSMGGLAGLREALRRPSILEYLGEYSVIEAERVLEEFMSLVARQPEMVAYGLEDVVRVALMNAVKHVVVLDTMVSSIDDSVRGNVEVVLSKAESVKARITIVPRDSPPGERIERLGGIIAVLRYPVPQESRQLLELQSS